jgi:hypothetical protein
MDALVLILVVAAVIAYVKVPAFKERVQHAFNVVKSVFTKKVG